MAIGESLKDVLARFGYSFPNGQVALLDRYCQLLWKQNLNLNLTRHTDYEKFVSRDITDSLQLSSLLRPHEKILDVGTGGGVPGVILAVVRPDLRVELCESVAKKARAVEMIVRSLNLDVAVHHARVECLLEQQAYDALVARAVGPMWKMLKWIEPHWNAVGRLLLVKGPRWIEERREARTKGLLKPLELRRLATYRLAGTNSEGVILGVWPVGARPNVRT